MIDIDNKQSYRCTKCDEIIRDDDGEYYHQGKLHCGYCIESIYPVHEQMCGCSCCAAEFERDWLDTNPPT